MRTAVTKPRLAPNAVRLFLADNNSVVGAKLLRALRSDFLPNRAILLYLPSTFSRPVSSGTEITWGDPGLSPYLVRLIGTTFLLGEPRATISTYLVPEPC